MTVSSSSSFASLFLARRDDYAKQLDDGTYRRVFAPLTADVLHAHLQGEVTIATYTSSPRDLCRYAVIDGDQPGGLALLVQVQQRLAGDGIVSYLEQSRREGHLWVFFQNWAPAATVRWWLQPYCPAGMEFNPKQDRIGAGLGSLIRLPLGVHRLTGRRYPFITFEHGVIRPVAPTLHAMLSWLETVTRVEAPTFDVPVPVSLAQRRRDYETNNQKTSQTKNAAVRSGSQFSTIEEWCAGQDQVSVIRRYVEVNAAGIGRCPFREHHKDNDRHSSFKVFNPSAPGGTCWHCYALGHGGNLFNFLSLYYALDALELWQGILSGARF
jgi:Uncharacterized protein conserved in bacteria